MSGLGCRVSDFWFRVSGFGYRVSSFGFQVSGSGPWALLRKRTSTERPTVSCTRSQKSTPRPMLTCQLRDKCQLARLTKAVVQNVSEGWRARPPVVQFFKNGAKRLQKGVVTSSLSPSLSLPPSLSVSISFPPSLSLWGRSLPLSRWGGVTSPRWRAARRSAWKVCIALQSFLLRVYGSSSVDGMT